MAGQRKEPRYHAFSASANGLAHEIRTPAHIAVASLIWKSENPDEERKLSDGFVPVAAIWDTGATHSVISYEIAIRLGLVPTGKQRVTDLTKTRLSNSYSIDLALPNRVAIPNHPVTEGNINTEDSDIHVLVGMDIIRLGDMHISNYEGRTKMSFSMPPCEKEIDLTDRAVKRNRRNKYD